MAFGGAICHGHQPSGFHEKVGHPGNIFWYQAHEAHKVYQLLDGKQQQQALVAKGMPYYDFAARDRPTLISARSKLPTRPWSRTSASAARRPNCRTCRSPT